LDFLDLIATPRSLLVRPRDVPFQAIASRSKVVGRAVQRARRSLLRSVP
jgi:hypothetical protein